MQRQNKAYTYAMLAILMWSTVASAFKIALSVYSPALILLFSSVTASILLFAFSLTSNSPLQINFSKLKISFISGLFNPFIYYLVLFEAYKLLPAQVAQPLNYTWPIVLTIFSSIFFKEKLRIGIWIGLVISFIGVIIISNQSSDTNSISFLGVALAIGSSLIWSIYWIINMKDQRPDIHKLFLNFLIGSILILIYILIRDIPIYLSAKGIFASIYIGIFEMGLSFIFWIKALKLSSQTAKINNLVFISPFLSFFFISIILEEKIEWSSIIGLIIIVLGIGLQKIIKI